MKKLIVSLAYLLLIYFVAPGGYFGQARGPVKKPAAKEKGAPSGSLLYKISGNGLKRASYIYGTIHVICPSDMIGMEKLAGLIKLSDKVLMEIDLDDPALAASLQNALNMPQGKSLDQLLSQDQLKKVDEVYREYAGRPVESSKYIMPTGIAVEIATSPKAIGCPQPDYYEIAFMLAAVNNKKQIEGLEKPEDQTAAMLKIPLEKQAEGLYKLALDPQEAIEDFHALLAAYKMNDSQKLYDEMIRIWKDDITMLDPLLGERNLKWIPKIEAAIAKESVFIAVGGGHLGGNQGILKLLHKRGYRVEAVKL